MTPTANNPNGRGLQVAWRQQSGFLAVEELGTSRQGTDVLKAIALGATAVALKDTNLKLPATDPLRVCPPGIYCRKCRAEQY